MFKLQRLKYYDGKSVLESDDKEEYILLQGKKIQLNRAINVPDTITIRSVQASRKHAVILHVSDQIVIVKDLNSANGTFINGKSIEKETWTKIEPNDVLGIGVGYLKGETTAYVFKLVFIEKRILRSNLIHSRESSQEINNKSICDILSHANNECIENVKQTNVKNSNKNSVPTKDQTIETNSKTNGESEKATTRSQRNNNKVIASKRKRKEFQDESPSRKQSMEENNIKCKIDTIIDAKRNVKKQKPNDNATKEKSQISNAKISNQKQTKKQKNLPKVSEKAVFSSNDTKRYVDEDIDVAQTSDRSIEDKSYLFNNTTVTGNGKKQILRSEMNLKKTTYSNDIIITEENTDQQMKIVEQVSQVKISISKVNNDLSKIFDDWADEDDEMTGEVMSSTHDVKNGCNNQSLEKVTNQSVTIENENLHVPQSSRKESFKTFSDILPIETKKPPLRIEKVRMSPRKKTFLDEKSELNSIDQVENELLKITSTSVIDLTLDSNDEPEDFNYNSTQDLRNILDGDSQLTENNNNPTDVTKRVGEKINTNYENSLFKKPSLNAQTNKISRKDKLRISPRKKVKTKQNPIEKVEEDLSKILHRETDDSLVDLDHEESSSYSSTQDLKNILMDDVSNSDLNKCGTPNQNKKFFKVKSPSKKPRFSFSTKSFYHIESPKKESARKCSKMRKSNSSLQKRSSTSQTEQIKSTNKVKVRISRIGVGRHEAVFKKHIEETNKEKKVMEEDSADEMEQDSQILSQYSITEDDVDDNFEDETSLVLFGDEPINAVPEEFITDEDDACWLKEVSQSQDSCALIINELSDEETEKSNGSLSTSFEFLKNIDDAVNTDDEIDSSSKSIDTHCETSVKPAEKPQQKNLSDVKEKIKTRHSGLKSKIELIEAPVIAMPSPRKSQRHSKLKSCAETDKTEDVTNGFVFYGRRASDGILRQPKTTPISESTNKEQKRSVKFQDFAEQKKFDSEAITNTVLSNKSQNVELNENPSIFKLMHKEKMLVDRIYSNQDNTSLTYLGSNTYTIQWICSWLHQQMRNWEPPPIAVQEPPLKPLKQVYTGLNDLYNSLEASLYYHIWNSISYEFELGLRKGSTKKISLLRESIEYSSAEGVKESKRNIFCINCSSKDFLALKSLKEKHLVKLSFSHQMEYFAYLTKIEKTSTVSSCEAKLILYIASNKEISVLEKTSPNILVEVLTRVDIEEWKGMIQNARVGALLGIFLNPSLVNEPPLVNTVKYKPSDPMLTVNQKQAVQNFLSVCLEENRRLLLIDGAAGTGKTTAVIKSIEDLLLTFSDKQYRVLIFGTNGAADESSKNFIELRKRHSTDKKQRFKFLRLDESNQPQIKQYSLKTFLKAELLAFQKHAPMDPKIIENEVDKIKREKSQVKSSAMSKVLDQALEDMKSYQTKKILSKEFLFYYIEERKKLLINNADILVSTLQELIEDPQSTDFININPHNKKTICIVEDANICTDLYLSVIFQLKIDKLILVGNSYVDAVLPYPNLYSKEFQLNLYRRLINAKEQRPITQIKINNIPAKRNSYVPFIKLNKLHRGNSILQSNIQKIFGSRGAGQGPNHESSKLEIAEWCLIKHEWYSADRTKSVQKHCDEEASLIVTIANEVKLRHPNLSVIILTPFEIQKNVILHIAHRRSISELEVSTILDFAGREADVVFLSTTTPSVLTRNILEIAFTRAKISLIVIGNFREESRYLKQNEWDRVIQLSESNKSISHVPRRFDLENSQLSYNLILKRKLSFFR